MLAVVGKWSLFESGRKLRLGCISIPSDGFRSPQKKYGSEPLLKTLFEVFMFHAFKLVDKVFNLII